MLNLRSTADLGEPTTFKCFLPREALLGEPVTHKPVMMIQDALPRTSQRGHVEIARQRKVS